MLNLRIPFLHRHTRRRWRTLGITLLILYFFLFSIFALFHAYAANELDGAHGCSIGQWIHLGLQAALFFSLVVLSMVLLDTEGSPARLVVKTLLWSDPFKRGPPRLFLSAR